MNGAQEISTIIQDLERKAGQLEAEARRYRITIDVLKQQVAQQAGSEPSTSSLSEDQMEPETGQQSPTRRPSKQHMTTLEFAYRALSASGQPMTIEEVTSAILKAGWVTSSKNPPNTVGTSLIRLAQQGRARKLGTGLYQAVLPSDQDGDRNLLPVSA